MSVVYRYKMSGPLPPSPRGGEEDMVLEQGDLEETLNQDSTQIYYRLQVE